MLFNSTISGLNIVADMCISFNVYMLSRPWAFGTWHCGGLSSSKEEVGEVGAHDFPPMLHILHCHQRPPSGGGRSQPGTHLDTWYIAVGHTSAFLMNSVMKYSIILNNKKLQLEKCVWMTDL